MSLNTGKEEINTAQLKYGQEKGTQRQLLIISKRAAQCKVIKDFLVLLGERVTSKVNGKDDINSHPNQLKQQVCTTTGGIRIKVLY